MEKFIEIGGFQNRVIVNDTILRQVVIDYFADVSRLKEFHNIEFTNKIKITSYESYWVLHRKPLQYVSEPEEHKKLFINEKFVFSSLIMFHLADICNIGTHRVLQKNIQDFTDTCLYFLKYRKYTAQSLELMILSFQAGICCDIVSKNQKLIYFLFEIYSKKYDKIEHGKVIELEPKLMELSKKKFIHFSLEKTSCDCYTQSNVPLSSLVTQTGIDILKKEKKI
jgi:hypothetical protein